MAVQVFDLSEILTRCKNTMSLKNGEPFRIHLHFDADINRAKREEAIAILRKIGYRQVGNTSSWILSQKPLEVD